ncbi:NAD-dependent epimerase/dehydratase family protein [Pelagicoccus sp. SDUM812005]|uniref:NAD-dependent epimerase/dehydratase family protein n=1 Tax=Pelagicoccus sp. SDUM812005 TaxID=3041257 RepID=UPI00280EF01F|nr:NAD-dependent epimerase/dehydratase family protein [Pelagicoccus sp. SDUM812005]MDQ8180646.1 NAD-dependent epimerase/dehydratase family protein [Pelagicoccus sp. SDUM812005]
MSSILAEEAISRVLDNKQLAAAYRGRRVLVLGADGFLGSYLALALQRMGADVTIVSRRERPLLAGESLRVFKGDLSSTSIVDHALPGQEIVFDMAGASGGIDSNRNAADNLYVESAPHLKLFESASRLKESPLVVFCSSRTVYGRPERLPVDEQHPTNPSSIYAVHKLALERYLKVFHELHGLRYLVFRLSNPYGPFPWQDGKSYGVMNQFISRALKGETLSLFGDGAQLRDYIFIEDVVDVFLRGAVVKEAEGATFNLGGPSAISMRDAATSIVKEVPSSVLAYQDWPTDYKAIETGDYVTDTGALRAKLGWSPRVEFSEGLRRTLDAYADTLGVVPRCIAKEAIGGNDFWEGRRVLVTGAGGSLGAFMCGVLEKLGAIVVALYRSKISSTLLENDRIKAIQCDLSAGENKVAPLFEEFLPEAVFHFASCPDGKEAFANIEDRIASNTLGTTRLLEAARLYGTERFLVADSCKVYGNAPVPHHEESSVLAESSYAATKYAAWVIAEIYARNHGLAVASLRPTLIYGPGQAFNLFTFLANCVKEGRDRIELSGGRQTRDPIFITDVIHAYLSAAQNIESVKGRALPIGGGEEASVLELSKRFISQRSPETEVVACSAAIRPGEILRSLCDNKKARELFAWSPSVDIETGFGYLSEYLFATEEEQAGLLDRWQSKVAEEVKGRGSSALCVV